MARSYFLNPHKATNQYRSKQNAYPTRLSGPFSNEQKASICILARTAADSMGLSFVSTAHFREWRQEQQFKAVGKQSLTECVQDDFLPVKAHFLNLAGKSVPAMNAHLEHQTEPERIAMHKLAEALAVIGKPMAYAAAICRNQNKCELSEANSKQIWRLVFTIKNRGPKKASGKAPVRPQKSAPVEYVPEFDSDNEPF